MSLKGKERLWIIKNTLWNQQYINIHPQDITLMKSSRCSNWKQQASYRREQRWLWFPFKVPPRFHPRLPPAWEIVSEQLATKRLVKDTLITARKQRRITALAYCCDLTDLLLQPFKNKKPPVNKWFPVLVVRWASPWKTSPDWKPPRASPASTGLRTVSTKAPHWNRELKEVIFCMYMYSMYIYIYIQIYKYIYTLC